MNAQLEQAPPLVVHVVRQLAMGGLENGLVNLINHSPPERVRHAIVCLTGADRFAERLTNAQIQIVSLGQRPGLDARCYLRLWRALRRLRPAVVHSRNIGTIDTAFIAWLAGVPARVHGEHGWDLYDLRGRRAKYRLYRRLFGLFIACFVAVSRDIENWLGESVKLPRARVRQIYNGVDTSRFRPRDADSIRPSGWPFRDVIVIGTVTRFEGVKDPMTLARGFVQLVQQAPELRARVRLAMIGDGPLREAVRRLLEEQGLADLAWIPGARDDVAPLLRCMDVFALTSLNEGISNTILEAMASGLPVVATAVGGNRELIEHGSSGQLVPAGDAAALARALEIYVRDPEGARRHGAAARERVVREFSLPVMVARYVDLYHSLS